MMTLDKWRVATIKGLDAMIKAIPDSVERAEVEDLFDEMKDALEAVVELEEEEDE